MTTLGKVAVIGGTGKLGAALARRWSKAGLEVVLGSRSAANAEAKAAELGFDLSGTSNADAAGQAEIIVVTVPWDAQLATLGEIGPYVAGKLVVDTTVPLVPPKVMRVQLPPEGSSALRAKALLGDSAKLVSAFHNVAAHKLAADQEVECDVLVFGDDKASRTKTIELARYAGLRGLHGGALVNSAAAEALTSVLIFINKTYAVDGAGLRVTGKLIEPQD
jgi:NADPH-dependent F420 reductase